MSTATATATRKPAAKAPADSVNVTNKPEVIAAIREAARLKAIEKAGEDAKKARKALEDTIIRPALDGKRFGILRGVKAVTVSTPRHHTSVNLAKLREAFPEAYEATEVVTDFDFLTYNV